MRNRSGRWFDVHEKELGLFLWTVALLFLVRSSGIFLNNYAETAFLKRYGVEFMPIVNIANAVAAFFVMAFMTALMTRFSDARLLRWLFAFCGLSVAAIRAIIPFGVDLIYPVLFMLKAQYEVLLALLFWNLANDLFNTRQSKRLFPLITAGGVVGQILGSVATPVVARWLDIDDLLIVYTSTTVAGAGLVWAMGRRYPALLFREEPKDKREERGSVIDSIRIVLPMMQSSLLLKILVTITFVSNILIPLMNYQFNYAVDEQFATESGLIEFFGYFRGVLNLLNLMVLLFVGKLYDRFGLPVALMFHPFNYILVFLTFLLRFDAVAAVYARMSSNILRTTINIPAKAVVMGMFPESYRALVRPFLRGTVVRAGLILGSTIILFSEPLFHPRCLSLIAIPVAIIWVSAILVLKRRYTGILLDLLEDKSIDFEAMNPSDLKQLHKDNRAQTRLLRRFGETSGNSRLLIGQLLKSISAKGLDDLLLGALHEEREPDVRIAMIDLLSNQAGRTAMDTFKERIGTETPAVAIAMIRAGHRMSPERFAPINRYIVDASPFSLNVRAHAVGSLFRVDPVKYGGVIDAWLSSRETDLIKSGLIAVKVCRHHRFAHHIKSFLSYPKTDEITQVLVLESLYALGKKELNPLVGNALESPNARLRHAALGAYRIEDKAALERIISLLADPSDKVARRAKEKIKTAEYQNSLCLIESLSTPRKKVKDALLELLAEMSIRVLDVFQYVRRQTRICYRLIDQAQQVKRLSDSDVHRLLSTHLKEQARKIRDTTLQVLATQDSSGRMHRIVRGILSGSKRQRANALEAMDQVLENSTARLLTPLIEEMDADDRIAAGNRLFPPKANESSSSRLLENLLESGNWVTLVLTLLLVDASGNGSQIQNRIKPLGEHDNLQVSETASRLLREASDRGESGRKTAKQKPVLSLAEKVLHLEKIELFATQSIHELTAVAAVTTTVSFKAGETVFREGAWGDALYVLLSGTVSVAKPCNDEKAIELDRIDAGDSFGEMALFGSHVRSATLRCETDTRCLKLHGRHFREVVHTHPQVALQACRVLSDRIRRLHALLSERDRDH